MCAVREAIATRCRENLAALRDAAAELPAVTVPRVGGGWSAVVRIPAVVGEEELVLELLHEDSVAVYPGYFFDFPAEGTVVLSLLPQADTFTEGVGHLLRRIDAHLARG